MHTKLHILSFDIPYPPNYGGVIDVWYKLSALHKMGVVLTLHCFQYGQRQPQLKLADYCEKIYYYPRQKKYQSLPIFRPHIIQSRQHPQLLRNLCQDDHPILFEGLHSCFYLNHPSLTKRLRLVRMHNIEWDYYKQLAKKEQRWWKRSYFHLESYQLQRFEQQLQVANHILAISPNDMNYLQQYFSSVHYLPAFHPNKQVESLIGQGDYALYHGNLSVNENIEAVLFLLNKVFTLDFNYPLIIAGKSPNKKLQQLIAQRTNSQLIPNPSEQQLHTLVQQAHIQVLPTFQATGIKLKLLYALFNGRFCVTNPLMVAQTGLEQACMVVQTAEEWQQKIRSLSETHFTVALKRKREVLLNKNFNNAHNAEQLIRLLN